MSQPTSHNKSRRNFLRKAVISGGAAGAVVASQPSAAEDIVVDQPTANPKGYQETDHVRTYYQLARR